MHEIGNVERINYPPPTKKSWFFKRINKLYKPLARLIKGTRGRDTTSGIQEARPCRSTHGSEHTAHTHILYEHRLSLSQHLAEEGTVTEPHLWLQTEEQAPRADITCVGPSVTHQQNWDLNPRLCNQS